MTQSLKGNKTQTINSLTDVDLMNGIKNNKDFAFEHLYRELFPKVNAFILNNSGKAADSKDILQEGIIALWQNVQMGKFELQQGTKLSSYIFKICKNRWFEKLKSAAFRNTSPIQPFLDREEETNILDSILKMEEVAYIRKLFEQLGDKCKNLLTWFYYDKKSMQEIAKLMNYQPKTAKNEKYRCMMKLKKMHQG